MPGCPSRLRPYLEGEGITKKVIHGRPPPWIVVTWETNITMVGAAI